MSIKAVPSIMCRVCFTMLNEHVSICKCRQAALLIDIDEHMHIYVDDIYTTQQAIVYLDSNELQEVARELLEPFVKAIYADYSLAKAPLNFSLKPVKIQHIRATHYDLKFMKVLNRHKNRTSDGNERFRPTALEKDIL